MRPQFDSWVRKIPCRGDRLPTPIFLGFLSGSDSKESACNVGDLGLIHALGKAPEGEHSNLLQYSCLENPHGQRSLVGCSPWGHKESDTTEWLSTAQGNLVLRNDRPWPGIWPADSNTGGLEVRAPTRHLDADKVTGPRSQAECSSPGAERPPPTPAQHLMSKPNYQHTVSHIDISTLRSDTECSGWPIV